MIIPDAKVEARISREYFFLLRINTAPKMENMAIDPYTPPRFVMKTIIESNIPEWVREAICAIVLSNTDTILLCPRTATVIIKNAIISQAKTFVFNFI